MRSSFKEPITSSSRHGHDAIYRRRAATPTAQNALRCGKHRKMTRQRHIPGRDGPSCVIVDAVCSDPCILSKAGSGRPANLPGGMVWRHFLQHWFNLFDPEVEEGNDGQDTSIGCACGMQCDDNGIGPASNGSACQAKVVAADGKAALVARRHLRVV
jgi:hypothetical protein